MLRSKVLALLALIALSTQAATLPRKAPPLTIPTNDGKSIQLATYKEKVVVLAFILTTCPHCQMVTRVLNRLQPEYSARGVQILGSAIDEKAKALVPGFIKNFQPLFPVGYNEVYTAVDFFQHPPMTGPHMPMVAFISRDGAIVAQFEGDSQFLSPPTSPGLTAKTEQQVEANFRKQLDEMLKASKPATKAPAKKSTATPKKPS